MFFVYYQYDYYDNGGVGFESFKTQLEAENFIRKRLPDSKKGLSGFTLIEGRELVLEPVEVVKDFVVNK